MRVRQIAVLLPVSVLLLTGLAAAQSPQLDVIGIKLGESMSDVQQALKADNAKLKVTPTSYTYAGFSGPLTVQLDAKDLEDNTSTVITQPTETLQLMFTTPPSQPGIWMVSRYYMFPTAQRPSTTTTIDALRKKYGPETIPPDSPIGMQSMTWVFDAQGKMIPQPHLNTQCINILRGITSPMAVNIGIAGPTMPQWPQPCASIVIVNAQIQLTAVAPGQYATTALTVTMEDGGRYLKALAATRDVIAGVVKGQEDQKTKQMNQVGAPKL
ncbi:MAG TPA: hypothetical protein VN612_09195 [Acidobacteriaceae bacterium]|nr:hypothetical protein [Acidobacteriaceae bacterium]